MEDIEKLWDKFTNFLITYDLENLVQTLYSLEWDKILHDPITWVIAGIGLIVVFISKKYGVLLAIGSMAALVIIFYRTVPENVEEVEITKLLMFLGATLAVVCINIYFFLIRK